MYKVVKVRNDCTYLHEKPRQKALEIDPAISLVQVNPLLAQQKAATLFHPFAQHMPHLANILYAPFCACLKS
jgi:hypothetical protein